MARTVYEQDTDNLFATVLARPSFAKLFLKLVLPTIETRIIRIERQVPHADASGTIDIELRLGDSRRLLIENKIDAGYSVTREGAPQPERYSASIAALRTQGVLADSVLLAPQIYLSGTRFVPVFDRAVSYEELRPGLRGVELALLDAAIAQAETPYEPEPNEASAGFFTNYAAHVTLKWPNLVLKRNPNGNGVRPTESRTIYFDVPRTLREWPGVPKPRMSLQCRDSAAPSASVKIMLGGMGISARLASIPPGLKAIGGYLRPAGRSLGCVIDTPQLDTQCSFVEQLAAIEEGLNAADRLRRWWNSSEAEITDMVKGASV